LPVSEQCAGELSVSPEARPITRIPPRRGRVLVLDDDPVVLTTVRRALGREHDVCICSDPQDALSHIARDSAFDLILCDLMMPLMSGCKFLEAAVRLAPHLGPKTVFLTGGAFTPEARGVLEQTRNRCVSKPFDVRALRRLASDAVCGVG
jgi:CheY-like chemotaxis protein